MIGDDAIVIRTVTVFVPHAATASLRLFQQAVTAAVCRAREVRDALVGAGITVQTIRVSTSGPRAFGSVDGALEAARVLDASGVDYANLGIIRPGDGDDFVSADFVTRVIRDTKHVSMSVSLISERDEISCRAVKQTALAVQQVSALDPEGFSNLRFAASANVRSFGPFFPVSYTAQEEEEVDGEGGLNNCDQRDGDDTVTWTLKTALGVQGATVLQAIVKQCTVLPSLNAKGKGEPRVKEDVYDQFRAAIEYTSDKLREIVSLITDVSIDFSTAPLPGIEHSVGDAFLKCARSDTFPGPGALCVAARFAAAIDTAKFPRTGYCGLMLPVSEDSVLARDAPNLNDLLTCSAVCGTGLDTVPVPGNISHTAIEAVLSDVASLSLRLGKKQLSIRLMPIPGKQAGETTIFTSPYFANGPVLDIGDCFTEMDQDDDDQGKDVAIPPFRTGQPSS